MKLLNHGSVDELKSFLMSCDSEIREELVEALDDHQATATQFKVRKAPDQLGRKAIKNSTKKVLVCCRVFWGRTCADLFGIGSQEIREEKKEQIVRRLK
jgi:hypothetical protein